MKKLKTLKFVIMAVALSIIHALAFRDEGIIDGAITSSMLYGMAMFTAGGAAVQDIFSALDAWLGVGKENDCDG